MSRRGVQGALPPQGIQNMGGQRSGIGVSGAADGLHRAERPEAQWDEEQQDVDDHRRLGEGEPQAIDGHDDPARRDPHGELVIDAAAEQREQDQRPLSAVRACRARPRMR